MEATATPILAESTRERMADSLKRIVEEADEMLRSAQRGGGEQFAAVRDKLTAQLKRLREELAELEDDAMIKARHAARVTDHAVHEHPYTAMGIAGGIGVLLGMLLARR